MTTFSKDLPQGVIPITVDGGGDMLCLDYRFDPSAPLINYYAHELGDDGLFFLATNITELLESLR